MQTCTLRSGHNEIDFLSASKPMAKKIKTFVYYLLSFETFWSFSTVIVFLLRLAEIYISQDLSPRRMNKSWFFFWDLCLG